jgi:acyl carrier protein/aryl carrier-like protein
MLISGRLDDQVKVRGNRVELNEINALLLQSDYIRNCTTLVVGQEASSQSIASFIVPMPDTPLDTIHETTINRLFESLEEALPTYMIPNTITAITHIPRTSQGKLDQTALRQALVSGNSTFARTFIREDEGGGSGDDWSDEEIKIADVLARLLSIESKDISRHTSLFSLGLNSLSAISFSKRLSDALNAQVNVGTIIRCSSVARLARAIEHESSGIATNGHAEESDILPTHVSGYVRKLSPFSEQDIERVLPCTPLQEAMLSASTATTGEAYWSTLTLSFHGDVQRLKRCWEQMVKRHDILRTRFVRTNDLTYPFVQVVLQDAMLQWNDQNSPWTEPDERDLSPSIREKRDLAFLPPFRIDSYQSGHKRSITLHMHHAIYDGISMSQLLEEVESDYMGVGLYPTVSFEPFLREAKKHCGQEAIDFWSNELDNFKPQPFPGSSRKGDFQERLIINNLSITTTALDRWCKDHSMSQLAVFQTAFVKTLAASQHTSDVCFGNVVSGRTIPVEGVDRLVAPCFNTAPVRIRLREFESNVEVASRLNRKNINMMPFQLTPLRRLQSLSQRPAKHLFDCLLILQPPQRSLDSDIWTIDQETGTMDMPLVFELVPNGGKIDLVVHYSERYVSKSEASCLWDAFSSALSSILRYPSGSIANFDGFDHSRISGMLAAQEEPLEDVNGETTPASAHVENSVREVFARLSGLSMNSIRRDTSMFQIGLDSLNAPQVAVHLRSAGLGVDAGDVLECLTPAAIAIRSQNGSPKHRIREVDIDTFDRRNRRKILKTLRTSSDAIESVWPCTAVQSGMLSQSLQSNGELYINHITYRVPRAVSQQDVQAAWKKLAANYQVLRMGFHRTGDPKTPFAMSILKQAYAPAPVYELHTKTSVKAAETTAKDLIMRSISEHAWCVQLFTQNDELLMTLSLHHALYDADSLSLILNDLSKALTSSNLNLPATVEASLTANLNATFDSSEAGSKFWSNELQNSL